MADGNLSIPGQTLPSQNCGTRPIPVPPRAPSAYPPPVTTDGTAGVINIVPSGESIERINPYLLSVSPPTNLWPAYHSAAGTNVHPSYHSSAGTELYQPGHGTNAQGQAPSHQPASGIPAKLQELQKFCLFLANELIPEYARSHGNGPQDMQGALQQQQIQCTNQQIQGTNQQIQGTNQQIQGTSQQIQLLGTSQHHQQILSAGTSQQEFTLAGHGGPDVSVLPGAGPGLRLQAPRSSSTPGQLSWSDQRSPIIVGTAAQTLCGTHSQGHVAEVLSPPSPLGIPDSARRAFPSGYIPRSNQPSISVESTNQQTCGIQGRSSHQFSPVTSHPVTSNYHRPLSVTPGIKQVKQDKYCAPSSCVTPLYVSSIVSRTRKPYKEYVTIDLTEDSDDEEDAAVCVKVTETSPAVPAHKTAPPDMSAHQTAPPDITARQMAPSDIVPKEVNPESDSATQHQIVAVGTVDLDASGNAPGNVTRSQGDRMVTPVPNSSTDTQEVNAHLEDRCQVCGVKMKNAHGVWVHQQSHEPLSKTGKLKPFLCAQHKWYFSAKSTAEDHRKQYHKEQSFNAVISLVNARSVNDVITTGPSVRRRPQKYSGVKLHKCTKCPRAFRHNNALTFHLRGHEREPSMKRTSLCFTCVTLLVQRRWFDFKKHWTGRHICYHRIFIPARVKEIMPVMLKKSIIKKNELPVAMNSDLNTTRQYNQSDQCYDSYTTRVYYSDLSNPYDCVKCSLSFPNKRALKTHEKVHNPRRKSGKWKQYWCQNGKCPHYFHRRIDLNSHLWSYHRFDNKSLEKQN